MKPIHRKRLLLAAQKFDTMLKQVKPWRGHHHKSNLYYLREECRCISQRSYPLNEHQMVISPSAMLQAAKRLTPMAKLRCLEAEGWEAWGNNHVFKIAFLKELGHHWSRP